MLISAAAQAAQWPFCSTLAVAGCRMPRLIGRVFMGYNKLISEMLNREEAQYGVLQNLFCGIGVAYAV